MKTSLANVLVLLKQLVGPVQTCSFVDHKCLWDWWPHSSVLFPGGLRMSCVRCIRARCYANTSWQVANIRPVKLYGLSSVIMRETYLYVSKIMQTRDESKIRAVCIQSDSRAKVSTSKAALFFMRTGDALAEKWSNLWLQGQWCNTHVLYICIYIGV